MAGQSHFAHRAGFQAGVVAETVEQIVEHRQTRLGKACARGPVLIGGFLPPKDPAQLLTVGQAQQRTIHAEESMPAPAADGMIGAIGDGQQTVAIEFEEGAVFELGAGGRDGTTGQGFKELAVGQVIEEVVEVALEGFDGLLEEEEHEDGKGQLAVAGEVLGSDPMAGAEARIAQPGAERIDQREEIGGNTLKTSLHPHVDKEGEELVRYKSSIISILHLIQWQCTPALSPRGEGEAGGAFGRGGCRGWTRTLRRIDGGRRWQLRRRNCQESALPTPSPGGEGRGEGGSFPSPIQRAGVRAAQNTVHFFALRYPPPMPDTHTSKVITRHR